MMSRPVKVGAFYIGCFGVIATAVYLPYAAYKASSPLEAALFVLGSATSIGVAFVLHEVFTVRIIQ